MIKNMPTYAANYKYIVYRTIDNENWFYGAYNDYNKAIEVAIAIDGNIA